MTRQQGKELYTQNTTLTIPGIKVKLFHWCSTGIMESKSSNTVLKVNTVMLDKLWSVLPIWAAKRMVWQRCEWWIWT